MKNNIFSLSRKITIAVVYLLITNFSFSQKATNAWTSIKESSIKENKNNRYIIPSEYKVMSLDLNKLKSNLQKAKVKNEGSKSSDLLISLPNPEGGFSDYKVFKNTTMHPDLIANFPEIRTYNAVSITNTKEVVKLDVTPHGFHAMILSPNGTYYIDPYTKGNTINYQIYYRKNYESFLSRTCEVTDHIEDIKGATSNKSFGSCELRTYRLALSCTGEYAVAVGGGTVAGALASQVTTMNRVNGVYERDIAITFTIIANNNLLIYTNGTTDPYNNGNAGALIGQSQSNITSIIGAANFDIGHTFSTGGGGLASAGVCVNSAKARGITGSANPQGDAFDIDFVAHEIGHQFSASHSYNNFCAGNRVDAFAYEPGSGSTIMAYAGICPTNVQNNSDDLFHGASLEQIGNFITTTANTCPVRTPLSNDAPTITGTNIDGAITIPSGTPFALTTNATDPDGDVLTYTWEQMDNEISTQPPVGSAVNGPNFRSISASTSPTRYFPNLIALRNGGPFTWEVLPTVSRTMNFRTVVRDNSNGGGCNDHSDESITIDDNSGPFLVTYPNNPNTIWDVGQATGVAWDVAGTDVSPVSCDKVDIFLSINGGQTYPIQIADDVDNTGYAPIIVPNNTTLVARVMVMCSNGTFFDISDNSYKIQLPTGINDLKTNQSIESFYNNQNIELSLTNTLNGTYKVAVLNTLGQEVLNTTINVNSKDERISIPFNPDANGIYYMSISNDIERFNSKFFKN